MVLSLITPIGSNFLKDWPAQHGVTSDRIDDYAGPCLTSHQLTDYTAVLTASTTNPTPGTGSLMTAKYYKIFDQIYTWGEFRFGAAGFNVGAGVYRISLPFKAKTLISTNNPFDSPIPVGTGQVYQVAADGNRQCVAVHLGSPDFLVFTVRMGTAGGSRGMGATIPFAWASGSPGDGFQWSARYQRDPS
jgi:hypothetical protein